MSFTSNINHQSSVCFTLWSPLECNADVLMIKWIGTTRTRNSPVEVMAVVSYYCVQNQQRNDNCNEKKKNIYTQTHTRKRRSARWRDDDEERSQAYCFGFMCTIHNGDCMRMKMKYILVTLPYNLYSQIMVRMPNSFHK